MVSSPTIPISLLLLTVASTLPASIAQSTSCAAPENREDPADFICQFNVTVTRFNDCRIHVIERFLLPYTIGNPAFRFIPALKVQGVFDIQVKRDGVDLEDTDFDSNRTNSVRVPLGTIKSDQPVLYEVQYVLSNAVMRYTRTCYGLDDNADPTKNVMRWRSGHEWHQAFTVLNVTFETDSPNSILSVLGGEQPLPESTAQRVVVMKENVEGNIEIYVSEAGAPECEEDLRCFPDGPNLGVIIGVSVSGIAVVIVVIACIVAKCCTRRLKKKHQQEQMQT